jgi:hypothetical protein
MKIVFMFPLGFRAGAWHNFLYTESTKIDAVSIL